jgi:cyanophycinase
MPSRSHPDVPRGWILAIGGNLVDAGILDRFAALSGGAAARIAIIPTASNQPDMGTYYERARRVPCHAKR